MLNEILEFSEHRDIYGIFDKTRALFINHILSPDYLKENAETFKSSIEMFIEENKVGCHGFLSGSNDNWCQINHCDNCPFRYRTIKEMVKGAALFNNKGGSIEIMSSFFSIVAKKAIAEFSSEVLAEIKNLLILEKNLKLNEEIDFTKKTVTRHTSLCYFSDLMSLSTTELGRIYSAVYIMNVYSKNDKLYLDSILMDIIREEKTNRFYNFLVEVSN